MKYYWWCMSCGKQGRVGKGHIYLYRSLRQHAENSHNDEMVEYLTINEYGIERRITYEKEE